MNTLSFSSSKKAVIKDDHQAAKLVLRDVFEERLSALRICVGGDQSKGLPWWSNG